MTAGQLRTLKKHFEELLSFEGTKSAKDKLVDRISSLYECLGKQASSDEFQNVYELGELSTAIFRSARKEVVENDSKWMKEQGKEKKTKLKSKMFELSIYHMKNCCQKHLDSNNVLWIPYCLSVLDKPWVQFEVSMEAEISTCLSLCAGATDLRWAEHKHVQQLWEFIWCRIGESHLDMAILKQYVELAVKIMQNVELTIFEKSPFHLVEKVMMGLKRAVENADSHFWTHSRKYSFVYILSYTVRRFGIEGRDLILREIFPITDHLQTLISVEAGESKTCMMRLIDDLAKLAVVERVGEHRTISESIEVKLRDLLRRAVGESLEMTHRSFFSRLQFSIPRSYVRYLAHWMLILRDSEPEECSSKSSFSFDALTTLSFGEHITPESHKCNAWNGAVELLIEMISSRKLDQKTVSQIVSNLWLKRKSFASDVLGSSFCSLLSVVVQDLDGGVKFGEHHVPSMDLILKYALSLMPKVASLGSSAHLVECILRFRPSEVPREMLNAICDTVSRTSPSSVSVLRLISAFISTTEFEESSRFCSINEKESGQWSLRKDIVNWLLAEPTASSHELLHELCQYHPQFCYEDEGIVDEEGDVLLDDLHRCRLISRPSTSRIEEFRPIDVSIEAMVRFVGNELQFLLGAELSLPAFILSYEFALKHPEAQFDFQDICPKVERISEELDESEFLQSIQHFTFWPKQLRLPSKFVRSEKCHVAWLTANLNNQQCHLEPQIFQKKTMIDEIARRARYSRAKFQQAMPLNNLIKNFIMENQGDLYQCVHRFEHYSFMLSQRNLVATRAKILEIASEEVENDGVVYEADEALFEAVTRSVCIKNTAMSNQVPGFNLDPYVMALYPENVLFNDRNVIEALQQLKKSPFLAQNIVRHVMEHPNLWHLHAKVLKYTMRSETLLTVCIATIPNMMRYLRVYQVHFNTKWRAVTFLKLNTESIDRCKAYLRNPQEHAASLTVQDLPLLFGTEPNKWRRAIHTFWRLFQSEPALTSETLHKYCNDCLRLSLSGRVARLLRALSASEQRYKVLADCNLSTIFGLIQRSISSMIVKSNSELVELCKDVPLKFDVFEHRLKRVPSNLADEFENFRTDIAFSVEKFLKEGVESDQVDYLNFELVEFYRQLNENMQDKEAKSTKIIDFLASAYQLIPSVRAHILPIVARFKHVSPAWERFPQPPHYSEERQSFIWKLRFHVATRLMQTSSFKTGEISSCVMLLLTSFDPRYYREALIGEQQLIRLKNGVKRNALCILSRILRQETRECFTESKALFEAAAGAATLFPGIAACVVPYLFKVCVDEKCQYDFAVGKLLQSLKGIDKQNQQEVQCLAECVDAMGLNVMARYERLPDVNHQEFSVHWFFALAGLFVDHGFLTHAFAIANIIFDRLSRPQRNIMMIDRISLDTIERGDKVVDLLVDIYVAESNSMALASLPPRVQTRPEVRKVMQQNEKEWLRLLSSDDLSPRESTIFRWLCGLRGEQEERFLDSTLRCQFTEYPKLIDSSSKLVYFLLFHRELNTDVSTAKSEILSKLHLSTDDLRLLSLADDDALFEPHSIQEHIVRAVRDLRDTYEHRKRFDVQYVKELNEKTVDMMKVARLLCENKAHNAASNLLKKWKEECVAWNNPSVDVALVEISECDVMCQAGDTRMAEIQLRAMHPKSDVAIAEWTMVLSRITLEFRNNLDEGIRLLEKGCKKLQNKESVEARMMVLLKFHSVCMDQLSKLEEYRESRTFRMKTEAISVFENQIKSARASSSSDSGESRRAVQRVRKEQQCEKDDVDKVERSVLSAAHKAIASGFDALECIGQLHDEKEPIRTASLIVFPLIDLIYKYEQSAEVGALLKDHIRGKITTKLWVAATSHIASKTFSIEPSPIQRHLYQLLCLLIFDYPYHVLHTVLMYENGKNGAKARAFLNSAFEMEKSRDMRALREIFANMREAHAAYRELTQIETKGNIRLQSVNVGGKPMLRMPSDLRIFKCKLSQLPIPTITQEIGRPGDYSTKKLITWKSWKEVFSIADGLSAPKVWEIQGSDGKWYKTVWKKDDVRQDVLVEQMFDVTNNMFERSMLRTYNVVPLDTECGIIEFCGGTVSIKEMLCGSSRDGGLHKEFNPREESAGRVSTQMREVQADSTERRREVFVDICQRYSPVFRHFFYTNFPTAHIWREKINEYRKSLATWSIVCYIVGLGDRHASNILFDQKLCTFVHIDLGMILEYSKRSLPVPEQVPFRVSRDLLDPVLIEGIENGQLADECQRTMEILKLNGKVLLGVASALLRETMTNFRETEQAAGRPSYISEMAIGRLRDKLGGTDDGVTPQASSLQVRRLLREATNADNLSRMFCGWMPFL